MCGTLSDATQRASEGVGIHSIDEGHEGIGGPRLTHGKG
jgi:hypothetical protein